MDIIYRGLLHVDVIIESKGKCINSNLDIIMIMMVDVYHFNFSY